MGGEGYGVAVNINGLAWGGDGAGGFDGEVGGDGLPCGDAADDAACVVGGKALWREFVAVLAAALGDYAEAIANFYAFDGVDGHQRVGDVGI